MNNVAIPRAVFPKWSHRPWSEMVRAVEDREDGIVNANELAKELWAADRLKNPENQFRRKTNCEFEICGEVAIFRHGPEFPRPDVAALFFQNW